MLSEAVGMACKSSLILFALILMSVSAFAHRPLVVNHERKLEVDTQSNVASEPLPAVNHESGGGILKFVSTPAGSLGGIGLIPGMPLIPGDGSFQFAIGPINFGGNIGWAGVAPGYAASSSQPYVVVTPYTTPVTVYGDSAPVSVHGAPTPPMTVYGDSPPVSVNGEPAPPVTVYGEPEPVPVHGEPAHVSIDCQRSHRRVHGNPVPVHREPAPAPSPVHGKPAPAPGNGEPAPAPGNGEPAPAPAPAPGNGEPAPAPAPGNGEPAPAPAPGNGEPAPVPGSSPSAPPVSPNAPSSSKN